MINESVRALMATILSVLILISEAWAFNADAHKLLNLRAADVSAIDNSLKEQLGFAGGLSESFNGRQARAWIEEGGTAEDQFLGNELLGAAFRSIHHFLNPLLPWDQAGLNALSPCPPFHLLGQASVRWAQNPNQGVGGKAAWGDARREFYNALTLPAKSDRDAAWAHTFQILGQQLHLIADLAVPAHTRNDPHCPQPEGFEKWASRNAPLVQGVIAGPAVGPDDTIFAADVPIQDSVAKVPVARLWDSDQYDGTNPSITLSPTSGLAEYTNANFFSDDTVFSATFPFPAPTSVELGPPKSEPKTGELRRYFKKVRDGELIDHLAVPSALYEFLPEALKDRKKGLDDNVYQDYAAKLLPRAVGYSAALLDYFFRGRLFAGGNTTNVVLVNESPEETMQGTVTLYYDDVNDRRHAVSGASWVLSLPPGGFIDGLRFFEPSNPPPKEPGKYLVVFQGTLGGETGAVVAKEETFVPSVLNLRLIKRKDGTPLRDFRVQTVEIGSETILSQARTSPDGKASLLWRPGRTILLIDSSLPSYPAFTAVGVRQPMYWADEGKFTGTAGDAKIIMPPDLDPEGRLTIPIPLVLARLPDRIDSCTGYPVCCPHNIFEWFPTSEAGVFEYVSVDSWVRSEIFVRGDNGLEGVIVDPLSGPTGKRIESFFLPEDLSRVGTVVGQLIRSFRALHVRGDDPPRIGLVCQNAYDEIETLPVTVQEQ